MSLPNQTASALRLLVIDDDAIDRAQVRRNLRKAAPYVTFDVQEAATPTEASRLLSEKPAFDCILLDYLLPGARATDILPALVALQPEAAIVVLTGQGDETIAVELMKAGVSDYLPKDGLDADRLWTSIKYAVAHARVRRDTLLFEQARRRRAAQQRALVEAAPFLSGVHALDELARVTAEKVREITGASACFVMLRDRGTDAKSLSCCDDLPAERTLWEHCTALQGLCAKEPQRFPLTAQQEALGISLWAREGQLLGTIAVLPPEEPTEAEACESVLVQVAQITVVALENTRLLGETQAAVRARDEVLAIVSHDLRTPLSNVKLGVALLRQHMVDRDAVLFERIERNVLHMTHLVNDLVDLARIEGSRIDVTEHGESVQDLLHAATALAFSTAEAAQVDLINEGAPLGLRVRADRHRTLQVLTNLIGNAIKFTPKGGQVRLCAEELGREICFHVQDTGRGISEKEAPHVFARFFRAPSARQGGLGLGLYIAKAVVDAHGGRIWFSSVEGQGTRFSFTLPSDGPSQELLPALESAR